MENQVPDVKHPRGKVSVLAFRDRRFTGQEGIGDGDVQCLVRFAPNSPEVLTIERL